MSEAAIDAASVAAATACSATSMQMHANAADIAAGALSHTGAASDHGAASAASTAMVPPHSVLDRQHSAEKQQQHSVDKQQHASVSAAGADAAPPSPALSGWLNKLGAKGLVKMWKTRWMVFQPYSCQLHYYETPKDLVPLG